MIILYPKKFKGNHKFSSDVDVYYWDSDDYGTDYYESKMSGLYDIVVLRVSHITGLGELNWDGWYEKSLILINTCIDCDYHSKNLDILINKYKQIETIWNEG